MSLVKKLGASITPQIKCNNNLLKVLNEAVTLIVFKNTASTSPLYEHVMHHSLLVVFLSLHQH